MSQSESTRATSSSECTPAVVASSGVISSGPTQAYSLSALTRNTEDAVRSSTAQPLVATADWEPAYWNVAFSDGTTTTLTREAFLDGAAFTECDRLIVESAHLKERNDLSVSQVYTAPELNAWSPPCSVYLFPARLAPKASALTGYGKDRDAESLLAYLEANPKTTRCLKQFHRPVDDTHRESWKWRDNVRDDICRNLNALRTQYQPLSDLTYDTLPAIKHARALVEAMWDELPEPVKAQYKVKKRKVGKHKGQVMIESPTQLMTTYCSVFDKDGKLRQGPSGFIGVDALMNKVVGLNHSHMPNMARANYMRFGLFPKIKKNPANAAQIKAEFTRNVKTMTQLLRDHG